MILLDRRSSAILPLMCTHPLTRKITDTRCHIAFICAESDPTELRQDTNGKHPTCQPRCPRHRRLCRRRDDHRRGFPALEGLSGIVRADKYLVVAPSTIYAFDLTVWGVIHLLVGLALLVIGIALLRGQTSGSRRRDVRAAAVSAIINFVWLPYSPLWAIMVIAVDILIIWALASYLRQPTGAPQDS